MLYFNISPLKRQQKPPRQSFLPRRFLLPFDARRYSAAGGSAGRPCVRAFKKPRRPLRKLLRADGAPRHSVSCSAGTAPGRPTSAISSRLTTASIVSSSAHLSTGKRLWMRAQTSST